MDILNPTPAAILPAGYVVTYRAVMEFPDLSEDEILALVVPDAMRARTPATAPT